jgi:hypothetical protein
MTTATGLTLVTQIMPRIARAISRGSVKPVGSEDFQELTSEGCAIAASALESLELRGKEIPITGVVYYALQREVIRSTARSDSGVTMAAQIHVSSPRIHQLKREVGRIVRRSWGEGCTTEVCRPPAWQRNIDVVRERRAARFDRSKA